MPLRVAFLCFLSLAAGSGGISVLSVPGLLCSCCCLSAGSEEAPAGLLAPVLALKDTAQHGETAHGHRARPRLAWPEEQRTPLEQFSGN